MAQCTGGHPLPDAIVFVLVLCAAAWVIDVNDSAVRLNGISEKASEKSLHLLNIVFGDPLDRNQSATAKKRLSRPVGSQVDIELFGFKLLDNRGWLSEVVRIWVEDSLAKKKVGDVSGLRDHSERRHMQRLVGEVWKTHFVRGQ